MLIVHRKRWFKGLAVFTSATTLWLAVAGTADAAGARAARSVGVDETARKLGVEPATLAGIDAAEAARRTAERRAIALERLRKKSARDVEAAQVANLAATTRSAHLPSVLGGVARATEEARAAAAARARGDRTAEHRLAHIAKAIEHGLSRAQRAGKLDGRTGTAAASARKLASAAAKAAHSKASASEVERLAPKHVAQLETRTRRPMMLQHLAPPKPRTGARLGEAPTPEQRSLYADLLGAPGLQVETELGPSDPTLLAAGLPLEPAIAIGGPLGDVTALLDLAGGALPGPTEADLQLGAEVRVTADIQAKVQALGGDPIAIYNFIHDGFDAEPYYGAKKGSVGAWEARSGNDADLSVLLVAMLRAAGIPARFEYGTVDLTAEQAMAWTGTTEVYQAGDALATGGVPTAVVDRGMERIVRVEHVWVRAWAPYSNYRGLPRAGSRSVWVRLDPTLQRARTRAATNLRGKVNFDYESFLAQVGSQTPLQGFEGQLRAYAQANAIPCKTLDDFIPARERIPDGLTVLPAELPAQIHSIIATFSGLPSSLRHAATLDLGGAHLPLALTETYGAAVTVRYRGATAADDELITAAGGIGNIGQPSSVRVVPTLLVDGTERARGSAVIPGTRQELTVQVSSPNDGTSIVRHQLSAGSVFAVALPVGKVPDSVVERHELAHSSAVLSGAAGDDLEAARANRALWRYFWHLGRDWDRLFGLEWARVGFGVSEGIAGRTLVAETLFEVPVSIRPGNFVIDVPRLVAGPYTVDGKERDRLSTVFELAGYDGSTWEHLIWEETVHVPSISTVRIFQASRQQGLALRTLTAGDAALVPALPFSDFAKEDITDALHRGLVVTIPERPVTWATYASAEGYVLKDPLTGAADFRIKGLYSGGAANGAGDPNPVPCPTCSGASPPAASNVSVSDGSMFFSETDLVVPSRGIPIAFTRRYNSASPHGGRLGPGWQHGYEVKLIAQLDGSVTWVNDEMLAVNFTRATDGSFVTPSGFQEHLEAVTGGYRLAFKGGLEYRFGADGQLTAIQDPNDHLVLLRYESGRLSTVTDASARTVLTFDYDASGLLASVRDLSNRAVVFGHENGDLVSVTDVTEQVQQFAYDSAHRMTSKTDRNGNTTLEFYDAEGRWVGSSDPTGNGRAVAYDMLNRRAVHEDKTGATTIYEYNERGNPVAVTDALGNRREMRWEANQKVWEKDARGNETTYTYDSQGNLETRTDALGTVTRYTYDGGQRVLTVTTNGKLVAQNTYDARGNLETATDALGKVTQYGYTADGLPETITQPGSAITRIAYNADGTVKSITDGEQGTTQLGYDTYGHLQSIKDPVENERTLVADAAGRILSMKDALTKTTTFEYDHEGNRTAVVDPDLRRTEFGYDALNRLETVKDALGATTSTAYDAEGRVLSRTDAVNRSTTHRYDIAGRLVETTDGAGNTTTLGYCADVSPQACGIVDPLGNFTEVAFDALGRPTTTTDAAGTQTVEHYDALGRRDSTKVAGVETKYEYDDAGRLKKVTDALLGVTEYGYDDRGNRTSVKDANGKETLFGYDKANRLLWERNPLQPIGGGTRYEYDAAGNRRFKTDGNERRTEYVYDANRRLKAVLFADGTRYDYDYDARGNRTLEKSPTHERGLGYDELGRLVRVEDRTLGRVIQYAYDPAGQRRRMWLDTGESVSYRWDDAGRLFETTDPQGQVTQFSYDAAGRRTGASYGNGTRATYAYDAIGQVLSIAYLDKSASVQTAFGYGYDTSGNRTYKAFADGTKEEYGYDALNRLTYAKYPDGREVAYGYDAVGNRKSLADTSTGTTRWAVSATASNAGYYPASNAAGAPDENSWQSSSTSTQWMEVTFASAERAKGIRIHETSGAPFVMRVDLVDEGGTAHTVFSGGDSTVNGGWLVVPLALTAYKVVKAKIVMTPGAQTNPNVSPYPAIESVGLDVPRSESYAYNAFNQLLSAATADGTQTTFGYDGNGNQTSKAVRTGWVTQTSTYAYDQDNRLRTVTVPSGPPGEATYQWASSATASDAWAQTGGWSASMATGAPDDACATNGKSWAGTSSGTHWLQLEYAAPVQSVGVRVHEAGGTGSVTKIEVIDEGGTSHTVWTGTDTTGCGGWLEVGYDQTSYKAKSVKLTTVGTRQIDAVAVVAAPAPGPTLTNAYEYDANGLRAYKSDSAGETRYLLDGLSVIAQYAPGGARQAWYTQSLARIDEALSVVNDSGKLWYQADALGSIYGLTSASGALVATTNYDVFGALVPAPTGPAGQMFGFTGREHELDSGLVYARARYLQPALGRWDRPDPFVHSLPPAGRTDVARMVLGVESELHPYAYVNQLATRASDPMGLIPVGVMALTMLPIGLQWDSIVIGVTDYVLARAEDAALISPTNVADCDACLLHIADARRIVWIGWSKPGDALLRIRMREYLLAWAVGGLVGVNQVLKLPGHLQAIQQAQTQLGTVAALIMVECKNPQLKELGWWYLYLATLRMPQ
jgi:RHS repeat-associated protein